MKLPTLKEAYFFDEYRELAETMVEKGFSMDDFFDENGNFNPNSLVGTIKKYADEDIGHLSKQDLIDLAILIGNVELGQRNEEI